MFFDLTVEDEELLTEESILGDELSFASGMIGDYGECNRMTRGLGEMEESPFEN